ncbi:probable RNA-binding protein EIF1AD isoform X3 [Homalodisca vitripennis]|uniref:probable RNA-binding protein EIF1AD isoform X3 n=1 Tax=Homalodisca vitripennis TaxID=197043 RepID=UPI001EEB5ADA|nr:probable RNA-binding protein EIF1AD isoform X3 [Homalodisca vitripennis]
MTIWLLKRCYSRAMIHLTPVKRSSVPHVFCRCLSHMKMSSSTKRKHVYAELQQSVLRVPSEGQEIVRVKAGRGNNLHDVESATGDVFLVSMPSKFRKNVWVKRGDFVLVERIPEGDKVKAEIITVLSKQHIRFFKDRNCWPDRFNEEERPIFAQPDYILSSSSSDEE